MSKGICSLFYLKKMPYAMLIIGGCFCSCMRTVSAGELRIWCGPSGAQEWSDPSNWKDGAIPTGDDSAYFPSTSESSLGKRYYSFKLEPPADFTGKILTTNELWNNDGIAATYQNRTFRPKLELGVVEGAAWTVEGNGCVVATNGLAARLSASFVGEINVKAGVEFAPPSTLSPAVRITGAGTLVLPEGFDMAGTEAFSGTVIMPESGNVSGATVVPFRNSSLKMADGATLSFDAASLAMRQTEKIENFVDDPGKWTFNGSTWADGNLPSGAFNPNPPYVKDGEMYLTDEPAQIHTAWYTNRTFRLTDDWGMSFTYYPELPSNTRITTEERADGKTRSQVLCGYFGILFQRTSPTSYGHRDNNGFVSLADNSYGFLIDLYRHSPQAKVMWVADGDYGTTRSVWESECGIRLDREMDVSVAMIKGEMTVTLMQDGKSATFSHSFAKALETYAAGGCYIGFGGESHWWSDDQIVPWVRNRISNFSGWYRDETGGPGWQPIENAAAFDIKDPSKWDSGKATWIDGVKTDRNDTLFTSAGVQLTDAEYNNTAFILSKANPPKRSEPLLFSCRFKTSDPNWTGTADGAITFYFGSNFANPIANAAKLDTSAFGSYGKGLDWIWDVNTGTGSDFTYSFHRDGRTSLGSSQSFGTCSDSDVAAMKSPEKDISADMVWNPNGTFKTFTTIAGPGSDGGRQVRIAHLYWACRQDQLRHVHQQDGLEHRREGIVPQQGVCGDHHDGIVDQASCVCCRRGAWHGRGSCRRIVHDQGGRCHSRADQAGIVDRFTRSGQRFDADRRA